MQQEQEQEQEQEHPLTRFVLGERWFVSGDLEDAEYVSILRSIVLQLAGQLYLDPIRAAWDAGNKSGYDDGYTQATSEAECEAEEAAEKVSA